MKTNKSFSKRIKKTKSGKLVTRKIGQGHFNAKTSGKNKIKKRKSTTVTISKKSQARFIK